MRFSLPTDLPRIKHLLDANEMPAGTHFVELPAMETNVPFLIPSSMERLEQLILNSPPYKGDDVSFGGNDNYGWLIVRTNQAYCEDGRDEPFLSFRWKLAG